MDDESNGEIAGARRGGGPGEVAEGRSKLAATLVEKRGLVAGELGLLAAYGRDEQREAALRTADTYLENLEQGLRGGGVADLRRGEAGEGKGVRGAADQQRAREEALRMVGPLLRRANQAGMKVEYADNRWEQLQAAVVTVEAPSVVYVEATDSDDRWFVRKDGWEALREEMSGEEPRRGGAAAAYGEGLARVRGPVVVERGPAEKGTEEEKRELVRTAIAERVMQPEYPVAKRVLGGEREQEGIIRLEDGTKVVVREQRYAGGARALLLEDVETKEPHAVLTVNAQGTRLGQDEILVKTWGENGKVAATVLKDPRFEDTGRRVPVSPFVAAEVWRYTPEVQREKGEGNAGVEWRGTLPEALERAVNVHGAEAFAVADVRDGGRGRGESLVNLVKVVKQAQEQHGVAGAEKRVYTVREDGTIHNTATNRDEWVPVSPDTVRGMGEGKSRVVAVLAVEAEGAKSRADGERSKSDREVDIDLN